MPESSPQAVNLPVGVYEALLTELRQRGLPLDPSLYRLSPLVPADVPSILAIHIASAVQSVLRSPSMADDLAEQIDWCNDLILKIGERLGSTFVADELVAQPGRQLVEIRRPAETPLAQIEQLARPTIPLTQNALLVAAKQEPTLARELALELSSADRVDLLCAFVKWSGIRVLLEPISRLRSRGVPIRIITTTYTGATESRALEALAGLGCQIKVCYESNVTRLHAKAWLFERSSGFSTAYIGSSNLSRSALHDGLEWNVRLTQAASPELLQRFRSTFETYWEEPSFEPYDPVVFREAIRRSHFEGGGGLSPLDIQLYPFQREMLYELEVERLRHNHWRNLVVSATGTGKTVVAAFDYRRVREAWGEVSLLFIAHRQEILKQSLSTFRNVLRDGNFGELMVAGERPEEGRHVFASIQSLHALGRTRLAELVPDAYDVVIVDEFHHAEAPTYRHVLSLLQPKLLLGLTATPDRADGTDIKGWFDGRIAVELRLWDALEQGLLCPFQYFGVADDVDLAQLKWRRGGYDAGELDRVYTGNDMRVSKVLKALTDLVENIETMKGLGFCVSVKHAEYMAARFSSAGIPSVAVSGHSSQADRSQALQSLRRGSLNVIFSVDLFNEGLDIPEIDTLMFLRPTESPVVFLQQLGRGLRRTDGKAGVTVLDFIGQQHRRFRFEARFRALLGGDRRRVLRQIEEGFPYLPAGCSITLDRQSERAVLNNIRAAAAGTRSQLIEDLQEVGDVTLKEFLASTDHALEEIYSGSHPGWTAIKRGAGFLGEMAPDEGMLSKALSRMLHVDDPERLATYSGWLDEPTPPAVASLGLREHRLAQMLHFDLWSERDRGSLQAFLERFWTNSNMVRELRELLEVLDDRAKRIVVETNVGREVPLRLHARYTRNEILAAFGETTAEQPRPWREGVKWLKRYDTDLFLVTLNKSERRFSPSTRYRDYPISPRRFHWESQSTTTTGSSTGRRYLNHMANGTRILLFVRESDVGDSMGASPFLFLGPASYISHEGERPIAIVWELEHEMPLDFFQAARVAA